MAATLVIPSVIVLLWAVRPWSPVVRGVWSCWVLGAPHRMGNRGLRPRPTRHPGAGGLCPPCGPPQSSPGAHRTRPCGAYGPALGPAPLLLLLSVASADPTLNMPRVGPELPSASRLDRLRRSRAPLQAPPPALRAATHGTGDSGRYGFGLRPRLIFTPATRAPALPAWPQAAIRGQSWAGKPTPAHGPGPRVHFSHGDLSLRLAGSVVAPATGPSVTHAGGPHPPTAAWSASNPGLRPGFCRILRRLPRHPCRGSGLRPDKRWAVQWERGLTSPGLTAARPIVRPVDL